MKRKNVITVPMLLLLSSFFAQADDALEWGLATPAEVYACDVREGSSSEKDTMSFVEDWKEWAAENGAFTKYTAQLMRPISHNGTYPSWQWLGYWPDYAASGADAQARLEKGGQLVKTASKFLDNCQHSTFGGWFVREPKGDWVTRDHVTLFANCKFLENKGDDDLLKANAKYNGYLDSIGDENPIVQWWPTAGGPVYSDAGNDHDTTGWDFKWIAGFPSLVEYHEMVNTMWNGGMYSEFWSIYGDVMTCDSARIYEAKIIHTPTE